MGLVLIPRSEQVDRLFSALEIKGLNAIIPLQHGLNTEL